jgi:hypothetical protein
MSVVTCAVDITAPAAELFTVSQDYGHRLRWDPFLREARLLDGAQNAALGVRAWCVARNGLGMETTYISFQPPTVVAVKMTRGPRIISSFAGSWRFRELPTQLGPIPTRVVFRYQISGRPRWLAFLLDPLLAAIIRRETQRRLLALKQAVETTPLLADIAAEAPARGCPPERSDASDGMTASADHGQGAFHG